MRKNFLLIILITIFHFTILQAKDSRIDSLLFQLNEVIAKRPQYLKEKENRLQERYKEVDHSKEMNAQFDALTHLLEEYNSFNTDSAYNITLKQSEIANQLNDIVLIENARLNRANVLVATGMYHEALQLLDSVKFPNLPVYLYPFYYHIKRTVYGYMSDFAAFEPEKKYYQKLTNQYRDSIMSVHIPEILSYAITHADWLNVNGQPEKAVAELTAFMDNNELSEHEKAICAWTLAESYAKLGDKQKEKEQLLIASISDLKSSVREYISLRQLAMMLYEEGDLEKAYELMSIAVEDASKSNARQRIVEINDYYPQINGIYIDTIKRQKKDLERTIVAIAILGLVLVILIVLMFIQMRKISRARKEIESAYQQLNQANDELKATNEKLILAKNSIAENSELKEVYIGKYMDQCLAYIEKLDNYRKQISRLINTGKTEEIKKLVKTDSYIAEELKLFYKQFDSTFLNLFPSFVEDLNDLLLPEEALQPKKDGSLNTELRIYALIRLGITDSNQIAKFLQYSLTTIYNYRVKVRNKALGDRNKLEDEVMKIGRKEH
ncbi:MAG: hypothetical protein J1E16_11535 [Muribaculaceae bacterium]|nr:hypothetical protein [Muribaculaceae bacterium]